MPRDDHRWLHDRLEELTQALLLKEFEVVPQADPPADATVRLVTRDGLEVRMAVGLKRGRIGHAAAQAWIERTEASPFEWLLAAPAIGREVANRLREARRSFVDAAGNCFLHLADGRFVGDLRLGPRSDPPDKPPRTAPANLRVLYGLLADPDNLRRPIRDLAARVGASYQTVATTLAGLRREGHLARTGRSSHVWVGGRTSELVDRFVGGWRTQLRPRLVQTVLATGRSAEQDETAIERLLASESVAFAFGGSAGAHRVASLYRSDTTVVHVASSWDTMWNRELRAAPSKDGAIVILHTIGADDLGGTAGGAHPLLLYAEVQTSTDPRERELATELLPRALERIETDG